VHQSLLQQSTPTSWWCFSACKPPPFSFKHNNGHYGQTVLFLFHQTRGQLSKKYDLCPHVQLQTLVWLLYVGFWYRTRFTVDIETFCTCFLQHLHKVLCCCSGIDLHFSHQSTFISRRQNASPSWALWRLRGPMVFILANYCLYRWTWYLQVFGNCCQGWTRLGSKLFFLRSWLISFDFPVMSSKEALSLKVGLKIHA
jgi:hypothetical protein